MELDRRTMLAVGLAALASGPAMGRRTRPATRPALFDRAIVIDGLSAVGAPFGPDEVRLSDSVWRATRETGVTAVRNTIRPVGNVPDPWGAYLKGIDEEADLLAANPDRLMLVRTAADILRAKRENKLGLILGTQDSSMVGPDLDRLAQMKKDGVMTVQLTYNNRNLSGDGALEPDNAGLSKLGRATIERIEAERLLLDLSHGGARTMAEAAAAAKRPLVISHTGARALHDHPRNTSDETIRAVAAKGGVVGVYFMMFLTADSRPSGEDLIRHIEHVTNVAGEDGVAIGSDNGPLPLPTDPATLQRIREWNAFRQKAGIAAPGEGLDILPMVADYNSIDRYRRLTHDLARRGWTERRIEKLIGANLLRVYRDAWGG